MSTWKCHGCGEGTSCPLHAQAEKMRDLLIELYHYHLHGCTCKPSDGYICVMHQARAVLWAVEGRETP